MVAGVVHARSALLKNPEALLARALRAWFARQGEDGENSPTAAASSLEEIGGKRYVVLRGASGIRAVYRVRNDGMLKGMRRWPKALS